MDYHRKICNKEKKDLIKNATKKVREKGNSFICLVDLCRGRGGDIFKWESFKIDKVLAFDNHEDSIKEAIKRYKKVSKKIKPRINFMLRDVSSMNLKSILNNTKVEIISCQFALHYFNLETIFKQVTENLMQGGFFIGIVPDGDIIDHMLDNDIVIDNVKLDRAGPSSYFIQLEELNPNKEKNGTKQYFKFRTEKMREFMIRKSDIIKIAQTNGLKLCNISHLKGNHISNLYFSFVFEKI